MNQKVKILITLVVGSLVLAGSLTFVFTRHAEPAMNKAARQSEITMPESAQDVASQLNCTQFTDLGPGELYVADSGSCYIGGKKYAIDTFTSASVRDSWLKAAEPLGVNPRWETDTSVTYPSVDS